MTLKIKIFRLVAFSIAVMVLNISTNLSDNLIGKSGHGYTYVNEIETIVEFVAEVILEKGDYFPENQIPGGTLGFEEEEKHFREETDIFVTHNYIPDLLYTKHCFDNVLGFDNHISEVITPPPQV